MKEETVLIPFATIRALLPPDGERLVVWNGVIDRWPDNDTPFMRNETVEVAFGKAIRAQPKHRKNQKSRAPGIACYLGLVHVRGGWAAHKHVPVHNDFFDGEFDANVHVGLEQGQVRCRLGDLDLSWNASLAAQLIDPTGIVRAALLSVIEREVRDRLQARLRDAVQQALDALLQRLPGAQAALENATLVLLPDGRFLLVLRYEEPPARKPLAAAAIDNPRQALSGAALDALGEVAAAKGIKRKSKP